MVMQGFGGTGAFSAIQTKTQPLWGDVSAKVGHVEFYASLSNSIYGSSDKVQPKSYQTLMIIKS